MPPDSGYPRIVYRLHEDLSSRAVEIRRHPFWMRSALHVTGNSPGLLYTALDKGLTRRFVLFRRDFHVMLLALIPFAWIIWEGVIYAAASVEWIQRATLVSLGSVVAAAYGIAFLRVRKLREQGFFFHLLLTPYPIQSAMNDIACHMMRVCLPGVAAALLAASAVSIVTGGSAVSFLIILPVILAPAALLWSGRAGARSALRTIVLGNLFKQRLALFLFYLGLPASAALGGLFSYGCYSFRGLWPVFLLLLAATCLGVVGMMYKAQSLRDRLDREFENQMTTLAAFQPPGK